LTAVAVKGSEVDYIALRAARLVMASIGPDCLHRRRHIRGENPKLALPFPVRRPDTVPVRTFKHMLT
jgi:hypothetical protein